MANVLGASESKILMIWNEWVEWAHGFGDCGCVRGFIVQLAWLCVFAVSSLFALLEALTFLGDDMVHNEMEQIMR